MRRFLLTVVFLALAACKRAAPPAATPDDAYRRFVQAAAAAHQGEVEPQALLEHFDASTRARLAARAKSAAAATGKSLDADPADQLLAGDALAPAVTGIEVNDLTATSATLQISTDGGPTQAVKMVLQGGRWRIHLDALPTAPAGG